MLICHADTRIRSFMMHIGFIFNAFIRCYHWKDTVLLEKVKYFFMTLKWKLWADREQFERILSYVYVLNSLYSFLFLIEQRRNAYLHAWTTVIVQVEIHTHAHKCMHTHTHICIYVNTCSCICIFLTFFKN